MLKPAPRRPPTPHPQRRKASASPSQAKVPTPPAPPARAVAGRGAPGTPAAYPRVAEYNKWINNGPYSGPSRIAGASAGRHPPAPSTQNVCGNTFAQTAPQSKKKKK